MKIDTLLVTFSSIGYLTGCQMADANLDKDLDVDRAGRVLVVCEVAGYYNNGPDAYTVIKSADGTGARSYPANYSEIKIITPAQYEGEVYSVVIPDQTMGGFNPAPWKEVGTKIRIRLPLVYLKSRLHGNIPYDSIRRPDQAPEITPAIDAFIAHNNYALGSADITAPASWSEVKREKDRLTIRSPDGRQQATISIIRFVTDGSFDEFKRMCQLRLEAEKNDAPDCFIQSEPPFKIHEKFGMFYSGGVEKTGRVFSGYLSLAKRELVTIYLEGSGVTTDVHRQTFKAFVERFHRK